LRVLIGSRAFADEHQPCGGRAVAEDQLVAAFVERAASAVADFVTNELEGGGAAGGGNGSGDFWGGGKGLAGWNGLILQWIGMRG